MSNISLVSADVAEPKELIDAIRLRRGGALSNLDRLLLNSPELASGWNTFLGAVRQRLSLPAKLRELAICAVAVLNKADYEHAHHLPVLRAAGGTEAEIESLNDVETAAKNSALFDAQERAVLQLTYEMTVSVAVSPDTLQAAQDALPNDQMLVELTAVIAAYNMVSRMIVVSGLQFEQK
ncbi:carboxymuconolactone decarboxylase family protein [Variovorax fucosicus]|uniref:carboxymuconolactone decarboxylase family protein n=1 Tax=Variovorax fucosicus TaxID=3053517 RepID=UPI0025770795|nr:carboxymuconolactone decarboxylase family protein [Variovorax sp. J22G47]MDM0058877.1 carboxymuconolactone decarboxylase family protein [Variovorax sp. J22G47]